MKSLLPRIAAVLLFAILLLACFRRTDVQGLADQNLFLPFITSNAVSGPPAPPANLQAQLTGKTAHLTWGDQSNNEREFLLEATFETTQTVVSTSVPANTTAWDIDFPSSGTWIIVARSKNEYGVSAPSNTAIVEVLPAQVLFMNETFEDVLYLKIDGVLQSLPKDSNGKVYFPDKAQWETTVGSWHHTYEAGIGSNQGPQQQVIYELVSGLIGSFDVLPGQTAEIVLSHPPLPDILTRFGQSRNWVSGVVLDGKPMISVICFYENGTYREYNASANPIQQLEQGTFSQNGNPYNLMISFALNGTNGNRTGRYREVDAQFELLDSNDQSIGNYQKDDSRAAICPVTAP